jgi:DNA-binding response OmpR family regulator
VTRNGQPLILIADDDPDILALVSFRLERAGYEVVQARNGEEAIQVDGYEATRQLRQQEETSRMPIILLTARVQEEDIARGFDAGADDYVRKPFSPQELGSRVQAALGR